MTISIYSHLDIYLKMNISRLRVNMDRQKMRDSVELIDNVTVTINGAMNRICMALDNISKLRKAIIETQDAMTDPNVPVDAIIPDDNLNNKEDERIKKKKVLYFI